MLKDKYIDVFDEYGMQEYFRLPCVHEKNYKDTNDKTIFGSEDFIFGNNTFASLNKERSLKHKHIVITNSIVIPSEFD